MTYNPVTQVLSVNSTSMVDIATYKLNVRISEVEAPSYFNDYALRVQILPPPQSILANVTSLSNPLIGTLDNSQIQSSIITINFNQLISEPGIAYDTIQEQGFITLDISGPREPYDFTWQITQIT